MTLDINELERLHAEARRRTTDKMSKLAREDALEHYLFTHAAAILSRLKAAEEMREALTGARDGLRDAGRPSAGLVRNDMQLEYDRRLEAVEDAMVAYDAASRPISATGAVDATGEVDNGASS